MKKQISGISLVLIAAMAFELPLGAGNYCWKDSYGRGVGSIPTDCGFSQEKQGLLCYQKCPTGMSGAGSICSQNCPAGFRDDGLFCAKPAAYGRGWGYGWQIQDGFSNAGMLARCQAAEGQPCEMGGAVAYPKCKANFHLVGWNVCSPDCPSGMTDMGVSCTKTTSTRPPISANCGAGQVYDTGLCYAACKGGYSGVGPVCYGTCPADKPVQCGAGCADSADTCAQATSDQVLSVVSMIENVALDVLTGGIGTEIVNASKVAATTAAKTLSKTITKQAARDAVQQAGKKAGKEIASGTLDSWTNTLVTYDATSSAAVAAGQDPPDFDWTSLDPTGIGPVVQAFNHVVCAPPPPGTVAPGPAPSPVIPAPAAASSSQVQTDWQLMPGNASDIAATAGGTAWAVGGQTVYRMRPGENNWTPVPGTGAVRIAAGGENVIVIDPGNRMFRWNATSNTWLPLPGRATDVAIDAAGNAYAIGNRGWVWEMKAGMYVWTAMPALVPSLSDAGTPVRISATGNEQLYVLDSKGLDYKWIGNDPTRPLKSQVWFYLGQQSGNGATDIAASPDGDVYEPTKFGLLAMAVPTVLPDTIGDSTSFVAVASGGPSRVWGVKSNGKIYKYVGVK